MRKQREQDQHQQDLVNIENKETTRQHLELIRSCTASTDKFLAGERVTPQMRRQQRTANDAGLHGGEDVASVPADAFYIRNRTAGGGRALRPGVDRADAHKLQLLDQVWRAENDSFFMQDPEAAAPFPLVSSFSSYYCLPNSISFFLDP